MKYLPFLLMLLAACSGPSVETIGDVKLKRNSEACIQGSSQYWLLDIIARTEQDSIFINTRNLKRKAELNTDNINKASSFHQILQSICKGDSVEINISSDSFYAALNSPIPPFLQSGERINIRLAVADRLDFSSYIAYKQAFERESMKKYISRYNWNAEYDSATGIYFEKLITDSADYVPFKKIELKYVLKNINEELIAFSKEGDPLIYEAGDSTLLPAIRFLARQMKEGESLRALVPSGMAYGAEGIDKVRPFMPIIIELGYLKKLE
jgi:hypothetical protein